MTGVVKNISSLLSEADAVLADGQADKAITAARFRQLMEDLLVSYLNPLTLSSATSYADDAAAAAGGVQIGSGYRNGNFICVRLS